MTFVFLLLFSFDLFASGKEEIPTTSTSFSVSEFNAEIAKTASFFSEEEESIIRSAKEVFKKTDHNEKGIVRRSIEDYENLNKKKVYRSKILLVGGGWKKRNVNDRDLPTHFMSTLLESYKKPRKDPSRKGLLYTVDIKKNMFPDLVGSISNTGHMETLPDKYFDIVILEYLIWDAMLPSTTFETLWRTLKSGGKLITPVTIWSAKTLPFVLEKTPFKGQIPLNFFFKNLNLIVDPYEDTLITLKKPSSS